MNRIIMLMPSLKIGGGNRVFFELANQIVAEYPVEILYPFNNTESNTFFVDDRIKITPIGSYEKNKIAKMGNILKLVKTINTHYAEDFIIVSDPLTCLFISGLKNKRSVYRFIQADDYAIFDDKTILKYTFFIIMYKFFCKISYAQKISYIFNSNYSYKCFLQVSGRSDVPEQIIYPAVNHDIFYNKHLQRGGNAFHLCLVGRKHKLKDLSLFIYALSILPETVKSKISRITIISHDDLSEFALPAEVTIVQPNSDTEIADIYNDADIFLSTSWWEGFGLPALEAMSCGCAVITSNNKGCLEYAVDGRNCLLFEPKDAVALVNCINKLMEDRPLICELQKNAEADALRFSWKNSAVSFMAIFSDR